MFRHREYVYAGNIDLDQDNSRLRIAQLVGRGKRVLDVGCANGYLAECLRALDRDCAVVGVELDEKAAEEARRHCEMVLQGRAEDAELWKRLGSGFDVIVFGDILEHLNDPVPVLQQARDRLSPEGVVIISLPNIAHYTMRWALLRGRFEYQGWGILDRTHLRFFTRATAIELLRQAGFRIERIEPIAGYPVPKEGPWRSQVFKRAKRAVKKALAVWFPTVFGYQFLFVARRTEATTCPP